VVFETEFGRLVRAPSSGFVLYAGEYRTYGALIILDLGCGIDVLVSANSSLAIRAGEQIEQGAVVGHVARIRPDDRPIAYLKVRRDGMPIKPPL
jgi:septal ring factor EnvC (AmiA/AmiB activator)